jgi:hypothetical protein
MADTQSFTVYNIPFTITGLLPNSYYTIKTTIVFISGNRYTKTFESVIYTINEGPVRESIQITDLQYNSATLNFITPIGNAYSVDLTVLETQNTSKTYFYPNITSPFVITKLLVNTSYDIRLTSFYNSSKNSYSVYKPGFFQTYNEDYPNFEEAINIRNNVATIKFSFTGNPSYNTLLLTNANNVNDTSFNVTNTTGDSVITFTGLSIDTSYNLKITSVYNSTEHTFPISFTNVFHTLNENPVLDIIIYVLLGNQITFTFIPVPGDVLEYVINLKDTNNNIITNTYNPEFISFNQLTSNMNYTLTIISKYIINSYTYTTQIQTPN